MGEQTLQRFTDEIKSLHPKPIESEVKQDMVNYDITCCSHLFFPFQLSNVNCSDSHRFSSCLAIATLEAAGLNCVQKSALSILSERVVDTVNYKGY